MGSTFPQRQPGVANRKDHRTVTDARHDLDNCSNRQPQISQALAKAFPCPHIYNR
jgi:hypothetical protein